MKTETGANCWLCGGTLLRPIKAANLPANIDGNSFRITDAGYGQSGAVYKCEGCGFRFCPDLRDALQYYEAMDDPAYEETRAPRALQAANLLKRVRKLRPAGRLLDIGAGSGILVEEARRMGFDAEGIEPSSWLAARAAERGLRVHHGTLPMRAAQGPYDVVTLIDVIEHVSDPIGLLRSAREVMAPGAIGLVVTPDVLSLAAGIMRSRWWHYRIAHICYFSRATMLDALRRAELAPVSVFRPSWHFSLGYLADRLAVYIAPLQRIRLAAFERITVPLNLLDSLGVIFRRADGSA